MGERTDGIAELRDREEIRRLFVEYARHLDAGDHGAYAALFASDGALEAPLGSAVGPAAIEALLDRARLRPEGGKPSIHVLHNQRIDVDGDTATAEIIWTYLTIDPDAVPVVLQAGRYVDDLVREGGVWKIARHDITRLFGRSPKDPAPRTRVDDLEERLQRLEDVEAIWRLFMTYKDVLDRRDFAAYAELFGDDGEWIGNLGRAIGAAQVERLLEQTLARAGSECDGTYHLVLNPQIDVTGDTATARSSWAYVERDEADAPIVRMLGRYEDQLRRTPAGWRFVRRIAYSDVPHISLDDVRSRPAPYVDPAYVRR